jgi:hypothetical protein
MTEQERLFAETQRTRVGFDIDEVLVSCKVPYDYRADRASYDRLPLLDVFEALATSPAFELFVFTGRLPGTVPKDVQDWVAAANPFCPMTLVCREWDHPVDRLTPADKSLRVRDTLNAPYLAGDFMEDYLEKYVAWKRGVVAAAKLDVYFDDHDCRDRGHAVARQFCIVR